MRTSTKQICLLSCPFFGITFFGPVLLGFWGYCPNRKKKSLCSKTRQEGEMNLKNSVMPFLSCLTSFSPRPVTNKGLFFCLLVILENKEEWIRPPKFLYRLHQIHSIKLIWLNLREIWKNKFASSFLDSSFLLLTIDRDKNIQKIYIKYGCVIMSPLLGFAPARD